MELLLFDVLVEFEGRLVVLVDISGGSRVISIVVRTESHKGLQIGKKFLKKTVDGCSVFESLGIGDVLVNVNVISVANWRQGVFLHILNLVQAVEDVTTKIVEERVVVILLVQSHAIVFQPIASGPVSVMKHAACKLVQNQSRRET
jgi:hypothetical protein